MSVDNLKSIPYKVLIVIKLRARHGCAFAFIRNFSSTIIYDMRFVRSVCGYSDRP